MWRKASRFAGMVLALAVIIGCGAGELADSDAPGPGARTSDPAAPETSSQALDRESATPHAAPLADPHPDVRARSRKERRQAARVEYERYITPEKLAAALEDREPAVRARATRRLDAEGEQLATLLDLVSGDPDAFVREAAARTLAAAEDPAAQQVLIRTLDDRDPRVVVAAIESLVFVGDAALIPTLEPLLQHRDEDVRLAADDAIYQLR